ncbi:recombinase family protein [Catalinimonas sp. 4WD22]|uniref:recombinase family protein n=1 Tax=Catalinimonas locisalis TaxID=3133978 RepID=UPI0031015BEA
MILISICEKLLYKQAGYESTFEDILSGTRAVRPELITLKEQPCAGDTLVVWRLDRSIVE